MRSTISKAGLACLLVLLNACALAPQVPVQRPAHLYQDASFKPQGPIPTEAEIFKLSPAMQVYLDGTIHEEVRRAGAQRGLLNALYKRRQLLLEYDSTLTRNAAESFESRSGNCLSLVIMTAAFAQALNIPVTFQAVQVDEGWLRAGNVLFLTGHVNLHLGQRLREMGGVWDMDSLTVDFLPPEALRVARVTRVNEATIVAMYLNNRAAEIMVSGDLDQAYWLARGAIEKDPQFIASYSTLAVILRRHGDLAAAERALRYVLAIERDNQQALANLALVLRESGNLAEAEELRQRLAVLQPYPPYAFFDRGMQAMRDGDYAQARGLFQKEVDRAAFVHEFQFWLALAEYRLGDYRSASRHMAQARDYSTTIRERDIYAGKLDQINAYRVKDAR